MSEFSEAVDEAEALARQCHPILAGHPSLVQGAALAELVARHLAGHVILGDPEKTKALRASLLEEFVKTVAALVPVIDEGVIQPQIKARSQ
jgi:hypothetical protein